jgi:hypothetical protein
MLNLRSAASMSSETKRILKLNYEFMQNLTMTYEDCWRCYLNSAVNFSISSFSFPGILISLSVACVNEISSLPMLTGRLNLVFSLVTTLSLKEARIPCRKIKIGSIQSVHLIIRISSLS